MKRVFVTGADGFVGSAICPTLVKRGFAVSGSLWQSVPLPEGCEPVVVGDIGAETDWSVALDGVDTVVHLAARAHVLRETASEPLAAYRAVNVAGTRSLAIQASLLGVKRFIFLSTIGVLGIHSNGRSAFSEEDTSNPPEPYGISKWEAECALREVAGTTGMETVIVRAPLIYGPGVKGNMRRLLNLAASGLPLPLGAVRNQRSLLYVGNLVDFIIRCIDHPAAANELFLLSDNCDVSTAELVRIIRRAMRKPPRLFPVPPALLRLAGRLSGKNSAVERLCGQLQVDCSKARRLLEWRVPFSVEEGVIATTQWSQWGG